MASDRKGYKSETTNERSEGSTGNAGNTTNEQSEGSTGNAGNTTNGRSAVNAFNRERVVVNIPVTQPGAIERKTNELIARHIPANVIGKPAELIDSLMNPRFAAKTGAGRTGGQYEYSAGPSLGGITGGTSGQSVAQTSLSERAQAALADAKKRLAALKPMEAPRDPENIEALRAVTLGTYKRLVRELSFGGGLRPTRVDKHFFVLIGPKENDVNVLHDNSLLQQIVNDFTLTNDTKINTREDSANMANFRIVKENLFDIYRSWIAFKTEVRKDFSELSGKLSRELAMIDNEVTDVESAMDEIGYDVQDREGDVIESNETPPQELTVNGLLMWIREFVSDEAPELIEEGGAIGIKATIPTLKQLTELANKLATEPPVKEDNLIASLTSLHTHLNEALKHAKQITGQQ